MSKTLTLNDSPKIVTKRIILTDQKFKTKFYYRLSIRHLELDGLNSDACSDHMLPPVALSISLDLEATSIHH